MPIPEYTLTVGISFFLSVKPTGARSWAFIWRRGKRRREMGLGGYPQVTLVEARKAATEPRAMLAKGIDPLTAKREAALVAPANMTFRAVAEATIDKMAANWSPKTQVIWECSLYTYAARLADLTPAEITTAHVACVLKPIWARIPESASKCRYHIETVLDAATVMGLRSGENPARWAGNLRHLLSKPSKLARGHHPALPYAEAPAFWVELNRETTVSARLLEFLVLTAARFGEAAGARWGEIDGNVWTVPAARMKTRKPHVVPLSPEALVVLEKVRGLGNDLIFDRRGTAKPMTPPALYRLLTKLGVFEQAKPHGFRSTFRDWAGDNTAHPREVVEAALSHAVGNETERAYRRGDALEKRRLLMNEWGTYLTADK
jgi:integrase